MARDAWTTGEVENWLLNDEELYLWAMKKAKFWGKVPPTLRARLRAGCTGWARIGRLGDLNVTAMRVVDWDAVASTVWESYKEASNG